MAVRLRKLRQRFGISASRVAVRTEVPWYLRWAGIALFFAVAAVAALWMYDAGQRFSGFDREEVQRKLKAANAELEATQKELERLRALANSADSRIAIERTAQQRLAQQVRTLEDENAGLREEQAIFERMLSSDTRSGPPAISIYRFKVQPDVLPGEYRYRLLLLTSGTQRDREFKGHIELVVSLTEEGKSAIMKFPEQAAAQAASFHLAFKYFRRVEGTFRIGPNAKIGQVQLRVLEDGSNQVRATQIVTLG
ncbi:MAG: DUF6776 family protein [Burkholderiales bacterium]